MKFSAAASVCSALVFVEFFSSAWYTFFMESKKFYKDGLRFTCQRCSFCCGHSPGFVYLSRGDLDRLCAFFKISKGAFVREYCRWADYYYGTQVLALLEQKNHDCILWKNGCSAYSARPLQCSTYPFWTWMLNDRNTWDECAKECPGMNKGRLWTLDEILENEKSYSANEPITRGQTEEIIRMENARGL